MSTNLLSATWSFAAGGRRSWKPQRAVLRIVPAILAVLLAGVADADPAVHPISGNHRLLGRFHEDGAIVQRAWTEAGGSYDDHSSAGRDFGARVVTAFRFGRDVEAGLIGGFLDRRREDGATLFGSPLPQSIDGAGIADLMIYGKYRIVRSPIDLAVGGAATLPLANEDEGRGPGVAQYEAFVGIRKNLSSATLVWTLGLSTRGDAESAGGSEGRASLKLGAGVLAPVTPMLTFTAEGLYESARFEGDAQAMRVLVGLDWRPTKFLAGRGGLGAGFTEGAPDASAMLSIAFLF